MSGSFEEVRYTWGMILAFASLGIINKFSPTHPTPTLMPPLERGIELRVWEAQGAGKVKAN